MKYKSIALLTLMLIIAGCAEIETKMQAYPKMYSPSEKPVSMLVVPVVNKSTAADAPDLINSTLTVPFADNGYYVMPISIVSDIFKREGITEGSQILGLPAGVFKKNFGADSVLYITINAWDTNYVVLAANVTVGMSYVLVSTEDNSVLWSYDQQIVVDTSLFVKRMKRRYTLQVIVCFFLATRSLLSSFYLFVALSDRFFRYC